MTSNLNLIITPRYLLPDAVEKYNCSTVISIFEPDDIKKGGDPTPDGLDAHHKFYFYDSPNPAVELSPTKEDVERILSLYPSLLQGRTMVHCFAGISRSSASAYALYCRDLGPDNEAEALTLTYKSAPLGGIRPNPLIVQYADEILERGGKMIEALKRHVRSEDL